MASTRSNGSRSSGSDAPDWARELADAVKAALREGAEDRRRADERMARMYAEFREQVAQQDRRFHAALGEIAKIGRATRKSLDAHTHLLHEILRAVRTGGNGRFGGNGRRFKP